MKKYVIAAIRHTGNKDYAVTLWGKNSSGYTPNFDNAGIYNEKDIKRFDDHHHDDLPILLEDAEKMVVEREYNYNGWEPCRLIINDEIFRNTFNIPKKCFLNRDSDKRYFRYKTEKESK